jgi:hypothetical protein
MEETNVYIIVVKTSGERYHMRDLSIHENIKMNLEDM